MDSLNLELYKKVYLIRRAEEEIVENYPQNEMKTPMHMTMGGEAISAGVCTALNRGDQALGTHRCHGIYLCRTQNCDDFFAEMYGKDTAFLKGKGGSMHMCAPDFGFLGASAIVASVIPVAAGVAFANKVKKTNNIAVVFFGDGAVEEGAFWESLNVACLFQLPVLFVCEDNALAAHTPKSARQSYDSIDDIAAKFGCKVFNEKTTDVEVIYNLAKEAAESARQGSPPVFLHLHYYRYLEHVGVNKDFDAGYRSEKEFLEWYKVDPVLLQRNKLVNSGFSSLDIKKVEGEIERKVTEGVRKAKEAGFAARDELYKGVFG